MTAPTNISNEEGDTSTNIASTPYTSISNEGGDVSINITSNKGEDNQFLIPPILDATVTRLRKSTRSFVLCRYKVQ